MTFAGVSCLMHIPIEGRLLEHSGPLSRPKVVDMMVERLGYDMDEGEV